MANASHYEHTTPADIAQALVQLLEELGWDKVYLHGGSWGSTLALLFAETYPERVLGMVVRGIWLGSPKEIEGFYRSPQDATSENIKLARARMTRFLGLKGFTGNPNSSDVITFYHRYFFEASLEERDVAAFNWWVHERFFMDEVDIPFCDEFEEIRGHKSLPEARSVAFWEITVMNHFLLDPTWNLLGANLRNIPKVPIDIVHGRGDLLCPSEYAEGLENALKDLGHQVRANYIDSGHRITNNAIMEGVREAVERFAAEYKETE